MQRSTSKKLKKGIKLNISLWVNATNSFDNITTDITRMHLQYVILALLNILLNNSIHDMPI